jgi:hypothetical protein
VRGNAITVERITRGLRRRGVELRVWDLSVVPEGAVEHQIGEYAPAVIHAFHAFRSGPTAMRLARRAGVPLLVTVTGTDVNQDLLDEDGAPVVRRVLEGAGTVSVFDESVADRIMEVLPATAARLVVIPQSAVFEIPPSGHWPPIAALQRRPGPTILFPAGIRMKRPMFPLEPLEAWAGIRPSSWSTWAPSSIRRKARPAPAANQYPWAQYGGAALDVRPSSWPT